MTEHAHDPSNSLRPLDIHYSSPITRKAWDILYQAQKEHFFLDMVSQLAESDGYQFPETPEEMLWWFIAEAQEQEEQGDESLSEDDEGNRVHSEGVWDAADQYAQSTLLRGIAIELLQLGIHPVPPTKRGE